MNIKYNNLFKYAGSKIQMLPHLIDDNILPKKGNILVEPFLGSCSLLLNTEYNKYYMNDNNKYIYDFLTILLNIDLEKLEINYKKLTKQFFYSGKDDEILKEKKEFYYNCKNYFFKNYDNLDDIKKSSLFIFLQANCFGGKPLNKSIGCGDINRNNKLRIEVYKQFQAKKDKIKLYNLDYKDFIKEVLSQEKQENITLYLDPPYVDSFKYNKDDNLEKFTTDILKLFQRTNFLLTIQSNYKNEELMSLYKEYEIIEISKKTNFQTKNKNKIELIIRKKYVD